GGAGRLFDLLGLLAQDDGGPDRREREDQQRNHAHEDHLAVGDLVFGLGVLVGVAMWLLSAHGCRYRSDSGRYGSRIGTGRRPRSREIPTATAIRPTPANASGCVQWKVNPSLYKVGITSQ